MREVKKVCSACRGTGKMVVHEYDCNECMDSGILKRFISSSSGDVMQETFCSCSYGMKKKLSKYVLKTIPVVYE